MALEEQGVPTVAVHTHAFARLARSVARANGMPTTRQAFVPQPIVGRSAADLRAYIEGADPISKQPFAQEIIEGLTQPLDDEDLSRVSFERSTPRLLEPDTEAKLHQQFLENRWTDYLPIVLPTEARVDEMLSGTSHDRDEVVGRLRPTNYREQWEFTVEKVAVNAVMAGARPEHFPVILAMAGSDVSARSSSTTSQATVSIINGPIRDEIGMNYGIGAMGPYNHANAAIGRAYGLLSQNLQGGSVPDETYMGSQGNFLNYNSVIVENEAASPWEPYHV
ncbi:MAG TPA: UGSC family (seleno)protein, partial [Gammaproteobacteria bacterium]